MQVSTRERCPDNACVVAASSRFCLVCGMAPLDDLPTAEEISASLVAPEPEAPELDPTDPNYWIYLMHDPEIVEEPAAQLNAGLAFYGAPRKKPKQPAAPD